MSETTPAVTEPIEADIEAASPTQSDPPPVQAPQAPHVIEAACAFLVTQDEEGHWVATSDVDAEVHTTRPATLHDFLHAAQDLLVDIQAHRAAQQTETIQQQLAIHMAKQAQTQAAFDAVRGRGGGGGLDLSKLRA